MPMGIHINIYEVFSILLLIYLLLFKFKELNIFFQKYIYPSYGQFLTGILFLIITAMIIPSGISKISKINKINDLYIIGSSNNKIGERFIDSVSSELASCTDKNISYTAKLLPDNLAPNSKIQNDVYSAYTENLAIMEQIKILSDELSDEAFGIQNLRLSDLELDKLYYTEFLFHILNNNEHRIYQYYNEPERMMTVLDVLKQLEQTKHSFKLFEEDKSFFTTDILNKLQQELYLQLTLFILSICGIYLGTILLIVWLRISCDEKIKWIIILVKPIRLKK